MIATVVIKVVPFALLVRRDAWRFGLALFMNIFDVARVKALRAGTRGT
jgi:hypothetical protein